MAKSMYNSMGSYTDDDMYSFEWDEWKNLFNIWKHKVSFDEAQEVFLDPQRIIKDDKEHSWAEKRFFCIGRTARGILTVRCTERNGRIRIFGAGYWRKERREYEEKICSIH